MNKFTFLSIFAASAVSENARTMEFHDRSWSEPRVTETPKRRKVWLPVINAHAKPLSDRNKLLARKRKR